MWKLRNVETFPVVRKTLGNLSAEFYKWMGKLDIACNVGVMQKNASLGTALYMATLVQAIFPLRSNVFELG